MTVAADTFAEFVDGLAEALDDHDRSGDDWAARHHFSRFHFDRMIKAVGGEPPQTLRRRILLERAAYRMITTKAPLLDIAIEAATPRTRPSPAPSPRPTTPPRASGARGPATS